VKVTRRKYSTERIRVLSGSIGTGAVSAKSPRMALAANPPGTIGMQPATSRVFLEMPMRSWNICTTAPTASAAANDANSRLPPSSSPTVLTASASPPAMPHQSRFFLLMLKSTPKPMAARLPKRVW
jgi:hypothetical protein